eukprot:TRINITY_DN4733_c0_g2_i1.p1 TRINITY_DN4733_c0_g2~~TRINITY_DN4733_c0_g2_i1.p1  ORF type:complete len:254 (+),score=49.42 TRINITY_DN4733_c0_g2_i1:102-863(+)
MFRTPIMDSASQCASPMKRKVKQQYVATRLCKFFLEGRCTRGTDCTFAHGETRDLPDYAKTRLCEQFMNTGGCTKGDACKFAHGKEEMQRQAAERKKLVKRQKKAERKSHAPTMAAVEAELAASFQPYTLWSTSQVAPMPTFMPLMPAPYHQGSMFHYESACVSGISTDCESTSHSGAMESDSNSSSPRALEHTRPEEFAGLSPVDEGPSCKELFDANYKVIVRNTFVEVDDADTSPSSPALLARSASAPAFV